MNKCDKHNWQNAFPGNNPCPYCGKIKKITKGGITLYLEHGREYWLGATFGRYNAAQDCFPGICSRGQTFFSADTIDIYAIEHARRSIAQSDAKAGTSQQKLERDYVAQQEGNELIPTNGRR